jgi:asparagine synthetase B (glutamine-hydrolysing)
MGYIGSRIPEEEFKLGFDMTVSRGPDMSRIEKLNNGFLGFHRLAIMGLTDKGMQPFSYKNNWKVWSCFCYKWSRSNNFNHREGKLSRRNFKTVHS